MLFPLAIADANVFAIPLVFPVATAGGGCFALLLLAVASVATADGACFALLLLAAASVATADGACFALLLLAVASAVVLSCLAGSGALAHVVVAPLAVVAVVSVVGSPARCCHHSCC